MSYSYKPCGFIPYDKLDYDKDFWREKEARQIFGLNVTLFFLNQNW